MPNDLQSELTDFERELGKLVTRFLRLYERLETEVRPHRRPEPPVPLRLQPPPGPPILPGYQ